MVEHDPSKFDVASSIPVPRSKQTCESCTYFNYGRDECRKDEAIVDEIPGAYKNIDEVMEQQKDLVKPLHTLKAVLCIKGD